MAFLMVWANTVSHVPGLISSTEVSVISPVFGEVSTMWSVCTVSYLSGLYLDDFSLISAGVRGVYPIL